MRVSLTDRRTQTTLLRYSTPPLLCCNCSVTVPRTGGRCSLTGIAQPLNQAAHTVLTSRNKKSRRKRLEYLRVRAPLLVLPHAGCDSPTAVLRHARSTLDDHQQQRMSNQLPTLQVSSVRRPITLAHRRANCSGMSC